MQQAKIDNSYFNEYMGFIDSGATEAEAVIEVANANEVSVCAVYDALVRTGLHNPCGCSDAYAY
jgi:hypothetical protein